METQTFSVYYVGETLIGEYVAREKHYLHIRLVYPFCNWEDHLSITGPGRMAPEHFLTEYGEERAQDMLIESYRKLAIIDKSIGRIANVYRDLEQELRALKTVKNKKTKERIIHKLEDWFFGNFLFTSSRTGLIASYNERFIIRDILKTYLTEKRKIYFPGEEAI